MSEGMRKLAAFPRHELLPAAVFTAKISELDLLERLGPPTDASEPLTPDPRFYWDLVWECGLVMAVEFHQLTEEISVSLSEDDAGHALRHLEVPLRVVHVVEPIRSADNDDVLSQPAPFIWELWHRDRDGRQARVEWGLHSLHAHCLRDEFNRRSQREAYRIQRGRVDPPTDT